MLFRKSILTKPLALFTGILFLNLSFILTEINAFGLEKKNHALFEILVNIFSASDEEEKDAAGENSTELIKEFCAYITIGRIVTLPITLFEFSKNHHYSSLNWLNTFREVFSPPPES